MSDRHFVDTNILVYAHDLDAGKKHATARNLVSHLWESRAGVLSTQVLQEFYVTVTRKISLPLSKPETRGILKNYFNWSLVVIDAPVIMQASEIEETRKLSFWDALILSAAFSANATTLLTEDLNHGQVIEGILIKNPFI
ncbi:MAG: PIN domain-containing protein [Deltaproteobacteria bacterium]|nr:PIN domain-containing protein [Deltaproteobacteria bacterium]MBW1818946.1 PIN domain-containing protein [Deltaproteobacteria bacterium]